MRGHVPFINTKSDAQLLAAVFPDVPLVRACVDTPEAAFGALPTSAKLWMDGAADALHEWPPKNQDLGRILSDCGGTAIGADEFRKRPLQKTVDVFVTNLLEKCVKRDPAWVNVPQVPISRDGGSAAINKALASSAAKWRAARGFKGNLVLPVILDHVEQVHFKTKRATLVKQAEGRRARATAEGLWIVIKEFDDQSGSRTNNRRTFPGLVSLHDEFRGLTPDSTFIVAGPYWGMGLVLWARGLADYTACGVGAGFRYFISGGTMRPASTRVAITPLRRLAVASVDLQKWIDRAEKDAAPASAARRELTALKTLFPRVLYDRDVGRRQIATWYLAWLKRINATPAAGRALALYQELSSAYVVGKGMKERLPKAEVVTHPERVAQQLMMSCL